MADFIIIAILTVIIGFAVFYIYKAKKSGKKCIGCPDNSCCSSAKKEASCSCGCCGCHDEEKK